MSNRNFVSKKAMSGELDEENERLSAENKQLKTEVAEYKKKIKEQQEQIQRLLNNNSNLNKENNNLRQTLEYVKNQNNNLNTTVGNFGNLNTNLGNKVQQLGNETVRLMTENSRLQNLCKLLIVQNNQLKTQNALSVPLIQGSNLNLEEVQLTEFLHAETQTDEIPTTDKITTKEMGKQTELELNKNQENDSKKVDDIEIEKITINNNGTHCNGQYNKAGRGAYRGCRGGRRSNNYGAEYNFHQTHKQRGKDNRKYY